MSSTPAVSQAGPGHGRYDAVVIGSGPNGLAAAITLARAGRSVLVLEAAPTLGGGARSAEVTLPGFIHDICSAIHPLGVLSPFFLSLPLKEHGLEWIFSPAEAAHPFDDGTAAVLYRSVHQTAAGLGPDAETYEKRIGPLAESARVLFEAVLGPPRLPRHPLLLARFGIQAFRSAQGLADGWFRGFLARGMFAGLAAHSILPLDRLTTAGVGLMFAVSGHAGGWPLPRGGSQKISDALASYLRSLGGEIRTGVPVKFLDELPAARAMLFDTGPYQLAQIAGGVLPERYCSRLRRYRYGPAAFKIDWALNGPIPWKAKDCALAATVHLGGTFEEVALSEKAAWTEQPCDRPFVLLAQQSLFDSTRAPAGKHTGWAYCHVHNGSTIDMTDRIEAQVERFAPGFRDLILARRIHTPADFQNYNANYIGGDITGGVMDLGQLFTRPVARLVPYSTPNKAIYLCSSSTPPGAGVHGMCGYLAAQAALRGVLR